MELTFEELDFQKTRLGELILRRRKVLSLGGKVAYEVKLNDKFLMSSLFFDAEVALAKLGIQVLNTNEKLDVIVGGLGLGYTAQAALSFANVADLLVIEALSEVIGWHQRGLVPLGEELCSDKRCRLVNGDFFELAQSKSIDPEYPRAKFHAILLDIDHTPSHFLDLSHGKFYQTEGLKKMAMHLHSDGVFAMWSDDEPDEAFCAILRTVFTSLDTHVISFDNPFTGGKSRNSVYVARV